MEGIVLVETVIVAEGKPAVILLPNSYSLDSLQFRVSVLEGGEIPATVILFKPLLSTYGKTFINPIVIRRDETDEFSFFYNHTNKAVRDGAKINGVEFRTQKKVVVKFEVTERNNERTY